MAVEGFACMVAGLGLPPPVGARAAGGEIMGDAAATSSSISSLRKKILSAPT